MTDKFPKPWRLHFVGDAYRVFDANDRHLFVITSDEILNEEERPEDATVLQYGTDDEHDELCTELEEFFDRGNKDQ